MQRTHSGRSALIRLATAGTLTLLLGAALIAVQTTASAAGAPSTAITVRVEGSKRTLVPATSVVLSSGTIVKDGVAADSCSGRSAAGARERNKKDTTSHCAGVNAFWEKYGGFSDGRDVHSNR